MDDEREPKESMLSACLDDETDYYLMIRIFKHITEFEVIIKSSLVSNYNFKSQLLLSIICTAIYYLTFPSNTNNFQSDIFNL